MEEKTVFNHIRAHLLKQNGFLRKYIRDFYITTSGEVGERFVTMRELQAGKGGLTRERVKALRESTGD